MNIKRYLGYMTLTIFLLSISKVAFAQASFEEMFPKSYRYFIKGGKEISYNQIDSVVKSWGGTFSKHGDGDKITLEPYQQETNKQKSNKLVGTFAKNTKLKSIDGKTYTLDELRGKIVVLNFWATWCVPCIAEMPSLNELQKENKDVVFFGISYEDKHIVQALLKRHTFTFNIISEDKIAKNHYEVKAYPTTVIIGPDGIIRYAEAGGSNDIKNTLAPFLK